jgi:hypothetical protein
MQLFVELGLGHFGEDKPLLFFFAGTGRQGLLDAAHGDGGSRRDT